MGNNNWLVAVVVVIVILLFGGMNAYYSTKKQKKKNKIRKTVVTGHVFNRLDEALISQIEIININSLKKQRINTDIFGVFHIALKEGSYQLIASKGPEYSVESIEFDVIGQEAVVLEPIQLAHVVNMAEKNWYAGDAHQHSWYSDGKQSVYDVYLSNISNGALWGVLSDHNALEGNKEWLESASINIHGYKFIPIAGTEVTTPVGHFNGLSCNEHIDFAVKNNDDIARIATDIKNTGAIAQINHPYAGSILGFEAWEYVELFDTIEIWNGKAPTHFGENEKAKLKWFELLNEGVHIMATGGSDNHHINGKFLWIVNEKTEQPIKDWLDRGVYSLNPMTYVYTGTHTPQNIIQGIKAGNSFITNGPIIIADVDGYIYGETVPEEKEHQLNISLYSNDVIRNINVINRGEIVETIEVNDNGYFDQAVMLSVESGDWIVLECEGERASYAITNPIFFD